MAEQRYTLAEAKRIICEQSDGGHEIRATTTARNAQGNVCLRVYTCVNCGAEFAEKRRNAAAEWCAPSASAPRVTGCVCPHHCYQ